jgi:UTP--glucose-1-phosphate uridylyltransferase
VYAFRFVGQRYDCGSKLGYIKAILDFAIADPALRPALQKHLASADFTGK